MSREATNSYAVPFIVAALLLLVGAFVSWFMVRRPLQPAFTEARAASAARDSRGTETMSSRHRDEELRRRHV